MVRVAATLTRFSSLIHIGEERTIRWKDVHAAKVRMPYSVTRRPYAEALRAKISETPVVLLINE